MKTLDKKGKILCVLTSIPVLAIMCVIFYFSSQTADASNATSGGFVEIAMGYVSRFLGDISAEAYAHIEHTVTFIIRKSAHFLEFAALGFFLMIHLSTYVKKRPWLISWVIAALYACSDEIHQNFVSERAMRFTDVCVDSSGAFFGILAVCILILIIRKIKLRRGELCKNEKA